MPEAVKLPLTSVNGELASVLEPLNSASVPAVPEPVTPPPAPAQFPSVNRHTVSVVLVSAGMDKATLLAWVAEVRVTLLVALPAVARIILPVVVPAVPTVRAPPMVALLVTDRAVPAAVNWLPATVKVLAWLR